MKKNIIALALVMAVGITYVATDAMAWGYGNCGWGGNGYNSQSYTTNPAYQDFLNSTAKQRAEIDADRAELAAVMAGPNPDPKKARSLTEQINENIATLNEAAAAKNLPTYSKMGHGKMGHGMMGHGMMGNHNGGYNYNCAWW